MKKFINKYLLFLITSFALTLSINVNSVLAVDNDYSYACGYDTKNESINFKIKLLMYENVDGGVSSKCDDVYKNKGYLIDGQSCTGTMQTTDIESDVDLLKGISDAWENKKCPANAILYWDSSEDMSNNDGPSKIAFGDKTTLEEFAEDLDGFYKILNFVDVNKVKENLISEIDKLNILIDDFDNGNCEKTEEGSETVGEKSCEKLKNEIVSTFDNNINELYDYAIFAGMKDFREDNNECKKDDICKKYITLKSSVNHVRNSTIKDYSLNLDGCIIDAHTQSIIDWIFNMVRLVGIILMIVLGMLDFIKAAASGEQEEMKKSRTKFVKRLIACVVLFLIPIVVNILLGLINLGSGANCS